MSPHQTAEEIAAPYGFGVDEHAEIVGKITTALQAASNAELERRRDTDKLQRSKSYASRLEAELRRTIGILESEDRDEAACSTVIFNVRAALSGGTAALDAVVAEATRGLREELDALAASIDGSKNCPKCNGSGYVDDGKSRTYYETDTAAEADLTDMWHRVKCPCRKVDPVAILAARDARVRAEGKREGLEEAYMISRGCHDYGGGYVGEMYDAYHHGMDTVGRVIQERLNGTDDLQMRVVLKAGEAAQAGEAGK